MTSPNFFILYVENPLVSAAFYSDLLARPAVECSAGFAMFALDSGVMLGLWARQTVVPSTVIMGGGAEVAFSLSDDHAVDALYKRWYTRGLNILQPPVKLDFGYTFVALDPDGHRLRVFAPATT